MNRRVAASVLVAIFVMLGLASPAIGQASSDAVLIMHFDEGSGTIAKEESGYRNDGTVYGATWATGISGKALNFDGVDDYVDIPDSDSFDDLSEFSVSLWINMDENNPRDWPVIIGRQKNNNQGLWCFQDQHTHHLGLNIGDGATNTGGTGDTKFLTVPINEWHFVTFTFDGTVMRNYIDGEYKHSYVSSINYLNSKTNFYIGGRHSGYFNGSIDEVAIWNRVLSPDEIEAHYLAKRAGGSTKEYAQPEIEDGAGVTTNGGLQPSTGTVVAGDVKKDGDTVLPSCEKGYKDCYPPWGDCETNIYEDSNNCGDCDNQCPGGYFCLLGSCVENTTLNKEKLATYYMEQYHRYDDEKRYDDAKDYLLKAKDVYIDINRPGQVLEIDGLIEEIEEKIFERDIFELVFELAIAVILAVFFGFIFERKTKKVSLWIVVTSSAVVFFIVFLVLRLWILPIIY